MPVMASAIPAASSARPFGLRTLITVLRHAPLSCVTRVLAGPKRHAAAPLFGASEAVDGIELRGTASKLRTENLGGKEQAAALGPR